MSNRILVADDELYMHRLMQYHLSRAGYEVVAAMNGREAVDKAASEHPQLVLMDVMMRGMDGLDALKELKEGAATRDIPVILITASAQITRQQAESLGAAGFFTKPFSPMKLLVEIKWLANRVQLTTDGLKCYLEATESAFGADVDFAQLVKIYGNAVGPGASAPEVRYSPAQCMGARKTVISGTPDRAHISTSHVERQNLNIRMGMRRFTRLTNAFSKKLENHEHAIALYFMYYNFARIHQTLRVTPAMEAGIADHVWTLEEIIALIEK